MQEATGNPQLTILEPVSVSCRSGCEWLALRNCWAWPPFAEWLRKGGAQWAAVGVGPVTARPCASCLGGLSPHERPPGNREVLGLFFFFSSCLIFYTSCRIKQYQGKGSMEAQSLAPILFYCFSRSYFQSNNDSIWFLISGYLARQVWVSLPKSFLSSSDRG